MVKFIHTADWQIGMKAAHVGAVGAKVRAARLEAAQRVVDVANRHAVDFMLLAGDTFEDNAVDRVLVQQVADILENFAGPVFVIPGNHDPLVPGSVWESPTWNGCQNVHVIDEAKPVEVAGATLYPCPLFEKYSESDPTQWIDATDCQKIAIGIAHGTVQGLTQASLDYPIARNAAERAGLDFLSLGHWHSFSKFASTTETVRMAYSGTHETTKFGERDSGNALLVEIAERGHPPKLTSIRTGNLIWLTLEKTLTDEGDVVRVREQVESIPDSARTLIHLRIDGILHGDDQPELERIDALIRARFLYGKMDTASLTPNPLDESWFEALPNGYLHSVAQRLQTLSDAEYPSARPGNAEPAVAARALLELYRIVQEDEL